MDRVVLEGYRRQDQGISFRNGKTVAPEYDEEDFEGVPHCLPTGRHQQERFRLRRRSSRSWGDMEATGLRQELRVHRRAELIPRLEGKYPGFSLGKEGQAAS